MSRKKYCLDHTVHLFLYMGSFFDRLTQDQTDVIFGWLHFWVERYLRWDFKSTIYIFQDDCQGSISEAQELMA